MLESKSAFIKKIFEPNAGTEVTTRQKGKLSFISVGSKFRSQLTSLMDKLRSTVSEDYILTVLCKILLLLVSITQKRYSQTFGNQLTRDLGH